MNTFYTDIYNRSYSRHRNPILAKKVAINLTKKHLPKLELLQFGLETEEMELITNSDTGEIEVNLVLANTTPRKSDGKWFSEEALQSLAEQINMDGSSLPDVEHGILKQARVRYGNNVEAIANAVKKEKGFFKKIKAAVKDGKLWVRAIFDKAYAAVADKFRKVSIEAFGRVDKQTKKISDPIYVGFTFTHTPELEGVGVAA